MRLELILVLTACSAGRGNPAVDAVAPDRAGTGGGSGAIRGTVVDGVNRKPLSSAFVLGRPHGDMTSDSGSFTLPDLPAGAIVLETKRPGYRVGYDTVQVRAGDTAQVVVALERQSIPCCSMAGQWTIALELDSAGPVAHPTARHVEGRIVLADDYLNPFGGRPISGDSLISGIFGVHDIDLDPMLGSRPVASSVRTSSGPIMAVPGSEVTARLFDRDSMEITLGAGGVQLGGRLRGDTLAGWWYTCGYLCPGSMGRFRMVRTSPDPGAIVVPAPPGPEPEVADTLARASRADVRVRVWDAAVGGYIRNQHELVLPSGDIWSPYYSGSGPDGWGETFSVAPGNYAVLVDVFQCGEEQYWLKRGIRKGFQAVAGGQVDLTIRLDTRSLQPARSYNNTDGHRCRESSTSSP